MPGGGIEKKLSYCKVIKSVDKTRCLVYLSSSKSKGVHSMKFVSYFYAYFTYYFTKNKVIAICAA